MEKKIREKKIQEYLKQLINNNRQATEQSAKRDNEVQKRFKQDKRKSEKTCWKGNTKSLYNITRQ